MFPELSGDPARDGASFVSSVLRHPAFQAAGVAHGRGAGFRWAVVAPERHPLYVWKRSAPASWSYVRTARALDAVLFTNGPMMGRRLTGGRKVTRSRVPVEFALWAAAGAGVGAASAGLAGLPGRRYGRHVGGTAGTAAGIAVAWKRIFTGWVPCGRVRGQADGTDDRRNFDHEGARHAWLGRSGVEFATYGIGDGDLPAGVTEGTGGLILLLHDYRIAGRRPGDPGYRRDFAELAAKKGVVAWALVPTGNGADSGVLLVLGGRRMDALTAANMLRCIGARDAVATDQSGSIMMGSGHRCVLPAPSLPRQAMQVYGLCCR
jgi:hypothetical protein